MKQLQTITSEGTSGQGLSFSKRKELSPRLRSYQKYTKGPTLTGQSKERFYATTPKPAKLKVFSFGETRGKNHNQSLITNKCASEIPKISESPRLIKRPEGRIKKPNALSENLVGGLTLESQDGTMVRSIDDISAIRIHTRVDTRASKRKSSLIEGRKTSFTVEKEKLKEFAEFRKKIKRNGNQEDVTLPEEVELEESPTSQNLKSQSPRNKQESEAGEMHISKGSVVLPLKLPLDKIENPNTLEIDEDLSDAPVIGSLSNVQLKQLLKQASLESEKIVVPTVRPMTQELTNRPKKVQFKGSPHVVPSAPMEKEDSLSKERTIIDDFNQNLLKLEKKLVENQKNTGTLIKSIQKMKRGMAQLHAMQMKNHNKNHSAEVTERKMESPTHRKGKSVTFSKASPKVKQFGKTRGQYQYNWDIFSAKNQDRPSVDKSVLQKIFGVTRRVSSSRAAKPTIAKQVPQKGNGAKKSHRREISQEMEHQARHESEEMQAFKYYRYPYSNERRVPPQRTMINPYQESGLNSSMLLPNNSFVPSPSYYSQFLTQRNSSNHDYDRQSSLRSKYSLRQKLMQKKKGSRESETKPTYLYDSGVVNYQGQQHFSSDRPRTSQQPIETVLWDESATNFSAANIINHFSQVQLQQQQQQDSNRKSVLISKMSNVLNKQGTMAEGSESGSARPTVNYKSLALTHFMPSLSGKQNKKSDKGLQPMFSREGFINSPKDSYKYYKRVFYKDSVGSRHSRYESHQRSGQRTQESDSSAEEEDEHGVGLALHPKMLPKQKPKTPSIRGFQSHYDRIKALRINHKEHHTGTPNQQQDSKSQYSSYLQMQIPQVAYMSGEKYTPFSGGNGTGEFTSPTAQDLDTSGMLFIQSVQRRPAKRPDSRSATSNSFQRGTGYMRKGV